MLLVFVLGLLAGGHPFLCLPKEKGKKERAAAPLRKPRSVGLATGGITKLAALKQCTPFFRFQALPPGSAQMANFIPEYAGTLYDLFCWALT